MPASFLDQMARVQQMADDADHRTWADLSEDDRAALAALLESHDALRLALAGLMADIDSGLLVRDVTRDGAPGWALQMLTFTLRLQSAAVALQRVEGRS